MISSQPPMRRPATAARRPRKPSASKINYQQQQQQKEREVSGVLVQQLLSLHDNLSDKNNMRDTLLTALKRKTLNLEDCFKVFLDVAWKDRYQTTVIAGLFHELTQLDDEDDSIVEGLTLLLEQECNKLLSFLTHLKTPTSSQLAIVTLLANLYHLEDLPEMHKEGVESYLIDIAKALWAYFMPGAPSVCLSDDGFIDAVCDILGSVGEHLDTACPVNMDRTFNKITTLLFNQDISQYARLRLLEIKEARVAQWRLKSSDAEYYREAYFKQIKQRSFDSGRPDTPSSLSSSSSCDDVFLDSASTSQDTKPAELNATEAPYEHKRSESLSSSTGVITNNKVGLGRGRGGFGGPRGRSESEDCLFPGDAVTTIVTLQTCLDTAMDRSPQTPHLAGERTNGNQAKSPISSVGRGFRARGGFASPGKLSSESESTHSLHNERAMPLLRSYSENSKYDTNNSLETQQAFSALPSYTDQQLYNTKRVFIRAESLLEDLTDTWNTTNRECTSHNTNQDTTRQQSGGFPNKRAYINTRSLSEDSKVQGFENRSVGHTSGGFPLQRSRSESTDNNRSYHATEGRFTSWQSHWSRQSRCRLEFPVKENLSEETDSQNYSRDFLLSFALSPAALTRPEDLQLGCNDDWAMHIISPQIKTVKDLHRVPSEERSPSQC